MTTLPNTGGGFYSSLVDRAGNVLFGGQSLTLFNGSLPLTFDLLTWNGYSWLPPDMRLPGGGDPVYGLAQDAQGTLYVGGGFETIGTAASVTTVVNRGAAATYPTLRMRNLGAGTANNALQYENVEVLEGDGEWVTVKGRDPRRLTFGISLVNPEWPLPGEPFLTGETFFIKVRRPADTWIKSGGVWGASTVGLSLDTDEALPLLSVVRAQAPQKPQHWYSPPRWQQPA
jgi:hypothetical protein